MAMNTQEVCLHSHEDLNLHNPCNSLSCVIGRGIGFKHLSQGSSFGAFNLQNFNKMMMLRPCSCFILLALSGLLLPSLLVPFWVLKIKEVEHEINLLTKRNHEEIWSVVQNATNKLLPMTSSAIDLAKLVTASIDETDLTFAQIETKVAPLLFQALLMVPQASQISYIGKDGLFFALISQSHQQIFTIYSNTSFSNVTMARKNYLWYTQRVDFDTGKLYGKTSVFPPQILVNETWVQQALNTTHGYVSFGKLWDNVDNPLVLNTARVRENGVISLGYELKSLMNVFSAIKPSRGGLYLGVKDGQVVSDGIPNTRMVIDENATISFEIMKKSGDRIMLRLNNETPQENILDISGSKYILYSSSLDILGMQSVYALALPYDGLQSKMHKNITFMFVLLLVIFVIITIFILNIVVLMVITTRNEMFLKASLIKQKEATQQAERKNKNKSLAFVSASHDIRASLAGITGLVEMSMNEVDTGSELAKNLKLVKRCSEDLHSILNSILDNSKIEAGKMLLEEKPFDLVKVLEGVVDLFYPVGLKKEVDVILDLEDGSLTKFSQVKGDERRLKQILSNLLSNAIKFTSDGYVSVRARAMKPRLQNTTCDSTQDLSRRCFSRFFSKNDEKRGDLEVINEVGRDVDPDCMEFVFEVNDTGKGIPKEKQKSVFENYVQVKETNPELEGTGLGLGIVQSLVRLMGGEISIVDKEFGENGTCFRFNVVFKVSQSEDEKTNLSSGLSTPIRSPKRRDNKSSTVILFISGEERRKMAQKFLRAHGLKVLAVKNTQQLSETLKESKQENNNIESSRSDLNLSFGYLSWPTSRESSPKDVPLSAFDGTDVSPAQRANRVIESGFKLLVLDTTRANIHDLCKIVAEFRKDSKGANFKVVWLGFRFMQIHGLDENELPPSDIVLQLPLHGSRLYSLIDLLPEFHSPLPCTPPHGIAGAPVKQEELQEISRISESSMSPLRGTKVLLVEDVFLQQRIAKNILSKLGVVVDTCSNGEEALTLVYNGLTSQREVGASHVLPYEYIFMDCQMPVMDGCEATRRIRQMEKEYGVHIPIIGLTAHAEGEELTTFLAAGIDIYVTKSLNKEKILKAIEDLHNRK